MRKSLRASVLVLALAFTAYAGEIPNPSVAPPKAPAEVTAKGVIHNPPLVELVLTLLALF